MVKVTDGKSAKSVSGLYLFYGETLAVPTKDCLWPEGLQYLDPRSLWKGQGHWQKKYKICVWFKSFNVEILVLNSHKGCLWPKDLS